MQIHSQKGAFAECFYLSEQGAAPVQEDLVYADPSRGVFIVCDGVNGSGYGKEAADIFVQSVQASLQKHIKTWQDCQAMPSKENRALLLNILESEMQLASKKVFEQMSADSKKAGSCVTFDLLLVLGDHALLVHVGPGRAFLLRSGELHQLSEDHTQFAQLRRAGKLDSLPEKERAAALRRLTRALGYQEQTKVDGLDLELQKGDLLLLVSDGFWIPLGEERMEKEIPALGTAGDKILASMSAWFTSAPKDNFSALLIDPNTPRQSFSERGADLKIQLTGKVPLFRYLSYQELIKVINVAELFKLAPGAPLCKEGELGDELMILLEGTADVIKQGKTIATVKKGDAFGEMSMIDVSPRSASVVASSAVNVIAFPRKNLFELLREEPALAVKFLWGLSKELNQRLRVTSSKLVGEAAPAQTKQNETLLPFLYSKDIH